MERVALDPSIIYLSMPMQGDDGPHRTYVGFGSTIAALSGLVASAGLPGRTPLGTGTHYPDHVPSPGHALVALLAALYDRSRTGRGRAIEVSQFESTVNVLGPAVVAYEASGEVEPRRGNRAPDMSPHAVLPAAGDDSWCAVVARDDHDWCTLCDVLGLPGLPELPDLPELKGLLGPRVTPGPLGLLVPRGLPELKGLPVPRGLPVPKGLLDPKDLRGWPDLLDLPDPPELLVLEGPRVPPVRMPRRASSG